jgi:hypothetical protein
MFITEMFDDAKIGYQSETDDQSVLKLTDMRKTRLTLQHLNRLRQANDVRKFEHEKKIEIVKKQYAAPAAAGPGMPGGL